MKLVYLDSRCVVDDTGCASNLKSALARGLPSCKPLAERAGRLACVGSGPSVRTYLDELKDYDEVWAINGAYRFLLDNGIVPQGFVALDPVPGLAEYVANPHKETTHYLSLMCDPSVFDALDGYKVVTWVPAQDMTTLKFEPGTYLIPGGTTALTRTPSLAKFLGWRDVTIYGADSSFDDEGRYAYTDGTFKEDSKGETLKVMCNGEGPFISEEALVKQVSQFGCLAKTDAIKLSFRCGGLMDAFLRAPTMDRDLHDEYNDFQRRKVAAG
jgi:hypothetical protein